MPQKKSVRKSIPKTNQPNIKQKPNKLKIIAISILVCFGVYFIVWNSKQINLEGNWTPIKITLNGKDLVSANPLSDIFNIANQVTIIRGENQILIDTGEDKKIATYIIKKNKFGKTYMELKSREKSLNGNFEMKIDTINLGPQEYLVKVKLHSKKTYLEFQKQVIVPPWKPELPRRGQV
ncbi:hypothetical protein [Flavobacterium sp. FlaQc-30]|uniref:hypothetical protein n=1 Tax=Flavobacterium sp. FlaQc-30 TaxID=3374179 RepID=UPI003757DE4E